MNNQITNETKLFSGLFAQLWDVQRTAPDFFSEFEDADPMTATHKELESLIARAPSVQVQYFLFGQLTARLAMSAATGRTL